MADHVAVPFQPAMIVFDGGLVAFEHVGGWIGEEVGDFHMQRWPIDLEGEKIVAAAPDEGLSNGVLRAHSIDGDDRAGGFEPFQKQRR